MSSYVTPESSPVPYVDPTKAPSSVPSVPELGATSAPLKSAAFFIGAYCKEYNGALSRDLPAALHDLLAKMEWRRGFYVMQIRDAET